MKFVDRIDEAARLKDALAREKFSLVVMYGRRRLGKSTLIKRVLSENDVYFLADRSEGQHQRVLLAKVIAQVFPDFDKLTYPDWESMFRAVNYRTDKRFTLCLDEFPYLVEQSSELPSVLQKLVDEKQLKYNLVLCGSSQNMMYGLFLDSTAPLYGRADEIMKLAPIHLPYIQEALSLNAMNAIEEYAVWGGVPRYWELRENRISLDDAIWHNILSVNGTLYEEPIKLFQDDVKDIVKTSTIMSYIGTGANRLSEIAARCNEPATNLSRPLKKLVDLGFLEKDVPFGIDEKNAKKSLYKIADPFMAFYYKFVVPNRSFIELGRRLPIEQALTAHFSEYVSMQWEKLCRDAVTGNLVDRVVYGKAKRWWGSVLNEDKKPEQVEFDVMAESLDKKYLLVGECKWTTQENGKQLTAELLRKANLLPFAKNYTIVPVLFLKNAPTGDSENVMLPENIVELMK
ncbi:ATP-binding protein [uncultured Alistipes sp.]|uniref:ATP-binding protein n=1 Tax=uncultured Alistipes sp. TaxID=538949 RepID=UPI00261CD528|nr:ATP-binding protein [uncultured Alistipes sp.]